MLRKRFFNLSESKSKIGWVHGIVACVGSFSSTFIIISSLPIITKGDLAYKIIPWMILTPIVIVVIGTWLLFSKSYLHIIKKCLYLGCLYLILVFIQGVY